ncbi:proteasome component region pci domain-containing protein [Plasmopara halstedii]|uniref:Proteasome component region pci domain-containing protein n=1 Tax=Plasmopara halstedii TaxID=4781 RepID=A0A0P1A8V8_PLAHL|nr:proteasome component region pci domain-containing protein [Plasmopara halstedii]CEG37106.1 proteasome component region pci domain-containing protein [Plasmopara halstedii]|eukprot:XP_024573475.1 proteasome component region pci domain-containing protein [Plasmopara halstedii]
MAFDTAGAANLEQFTLLAKNARGRACVALIQQDSEHKEQYELLRIFCFGTYSDYIERKDELPDLTPQQVNKLRKLSAVSLAHRFKNIPYDIMVQELGVSTVREVEDILIDTIYSGLIQGKLDQKSRCFVVKYAVGRDTCREDIDDMIQKLLNWKQQSTEICEKVNGILMSAEKQEEDERTREESIYSRMAVRASERGKGFASSMTSLRASEDFSPYAEAGVRRGTLSKQRVHSTRRKGRM